MDDLGSLISQIMNDPASMQQLQQVAATMGLAGDNGTQGQAQSAPVQQNAMVPAAAQATQQTSLPNVDLGALSQIMGALTGKASTPAPAPQPQMPDLSALAGLLGGGETQTAQQNQGPDLSALSGLLSGLGVGGGGGGGTAPDLSALSGLLGGIGEASGQSAAPNSSAQSAPVAANNSVAALANMLGGAGQTGGAGLPGLGGIDLNMIMKIQQAMSTMSTNQDNMRLLMGLKGHLKTDRAKKVDDAVRVMQLIQFLPLLKDSGLFGSLENLLGGFSLDGVLGRQGTGGQASGLSGLLGGLNLFGGR